LDWTFSVKKSKKERKSDIVSDIVSGNDIVLFQSEVKLLQKLKYKKEYIKFLSLLRTFAVCHSKKRKRKEKKKKILGILFTFFTFFLNLQQSRLDV